MADRDTADNQNDVVSDDGAALANAITRNLFENLLFSIPGKGLMFYNSLIFFALEKRA